MTRIDPVSDTDLHAYVDGELAPERRRAVEAWLAEHPADAARVAEYQKLNRGLQALYPAEAAEPLPAGLRHAIGRRVYIRRIAAAVAWLCVGGLAGWFAHSGVQHEELQSTLLSRHLVKPATFAHQIYSPEIVHPVEVSADQEQHLVAWLSKRLNTSIRAPNLGELGYRLVGGRLLPSTDRMAAQFMYQDTRGQRITLYIRRGAWDNEVTAFQYAQENSLGTFYWIDGPMGYALSGGLNREQLLAVAELVYRQLNP